MFGRKQVPTHVLNILSTQFAKVSAQQIHLLCCKIILFALLDANAHYEMNKFFFFEQTTLTTSQMYKARVVVNYTSVVVQLLFTYILSLPVTIK